jgi:hypothetical protein
MTEPTRDAETGVRRSMASLVVVHGIGAQRRAESLLEWSEPLLRRMDWISREVGEPGVQFGAVTLSDSGRDQVGARVAYRDLDGARRELYLTVTEARWSESFLALGTGEILTWGVAFVWRAAMRLGAHYSRVLWLDPWWRLLSGPVIAALWVSLVVLSTLITLVLPLLGILVFVPFASRLVHSIIGFLAEVAGDVAVWERRPVRAAAMRAVVRDELVAARDALAAGAAEADIAADDTRLMVVAHSQGAAIVAETLFSRTTGEPRIPVDVLVTAGAAVTLLGSSRWASGLFARLRDALMGHATGAFQFNPVEEWAALDRPPRWLNFWAIWDPFAAGPISTSARARAERWRESYRRSGRSADLPLGPEEHPVHNTALPFTDHQTYSANIAQVIDPVARVLLDIDPTHGRAKAVGATADDRGGAHAPTATRADGPAIIRGRATARVRSVKDLGLNRLLVVALAVASVVVPDARSGLGRLVDTVGDAIRDALARVFPPGAAFFDQPAVAAVVIIVAIAIVGLWVNGTLWSAHVSRTSWSSTGDATHGVWVTGLVVRALLVAALWLVLFRAADPGGLAWLAPAAAVAALLVVVVAPYLGRVPRVVPERR